MASIKPRSKYEEFFSVSDPSEPVRNFMSLYQRISEFQPTSCERAARLLRESRPLFNILPLRRRAVSIDNNSVFCDQCVLNSDYSRICTSKSVPKSGAASIYFLKIRAARARCAHNFSRRFTMLLVLLRFWLSYKMVVSIHLTVSF